LLRSRVRFVDSSAFLYACVYISRIAKCCVLYYRTTLFNLSLFSFFVVALLEVLNFVLDLLFCTSALLCVCVFVFVCILWLFKYMETLYAGCFVFAGFVPCTGSSYEGEGILWCCASKQMHITPNSHKHVVDPNMLWGPYFCV